MDDINHKVDISDDARWEDRELFALATIDARWEDWADNPCCYLECNKEAEWLIVHGDGPCDNTVSCTEHVGQMLTDAPIHYISHL